MLSLCLAIFYITITQCYADIITRTNTNNIAITFDACETKTPSYFDKRILDYIIDNKLPVTIFVSGKFAERNKVEIEKLSKFSFVEFENHSYSHYQDMTKLNRNTIMDEILLNEKLLKSITTKKTKYFRFPAGVYDSKTLRLAEELGYKVVHWAFPSGDPDRKVTGNKLISWVVEKTKPGDILIFHINGRGYATHEALPVIVERLSKRGMKFIKLEDGRI